MRDLTKRLEQLEAASTQSEPPASAVIATQAVFHPELSIEQVRQRLIEEQRQELQETAKLTQQQRIERAMQRLMEANE